MTKTKIYIGLILGSLILGYVFFYPFFSNAGNLIIYERFNNDLSKWSIEESGGVVSITTKNFSNKLELNDSSNTDAVSACFDFIMDKDHLIIEFDVFYSASSAFIAEINNTEGDAVISVKLGVNNYNGADNNIHPDISKNFIIDISQNKTDTITFDTNRDTFSDAAFPAGLYKQIILVLDKSAQKASCFISEDNPIGGSLSQVGNAKTAALTSRLTFLMRTETNKTGKVFVDEVKIYKPDFFMIGDSLTDGKPLWSNHPQYEGRLKRSVNEKSFPAYHLSKMFDNMLVASRGFGGAKTKSVEEHIKTSVLDHFASKVYIGVGHNDIYRGQSLDNMKKNMNSIINQLRVAGIHGNNVIIGNVFPSSAISYRKKDTLRIKWNQWLKQLAAEKHFIYVDLDAVMRDPSNISELMPGYRVGDDGAVHLNPTGSQAMARAIFNEMLNSGKNKKE